MIPFKFKNLKNPSLIQKLFGIKLKENGLTKINNLFAKKDLKSIEVDEIQKIAIDYKLDFNKKFRSDIYSLYGQYLMYCLKDKHLSDQEIDELKYLKEILTLNDKDIEKIHNDVAGRIYKKEVDKAVSDGRLDCVLIKFLG
jgi:hypothetical protein